MSSPLIFFVIVIVIDLVLKSMKDKKKAEKSRNRDLTQGDIQNTNQTRQPNPPKRSNTIKDLRDALEREFEAGKTKYENLDGRKEQIPEPKAKDQYARPKEKSTRMERIENQKQKVNRNSETSISQRLEREDALNRNRLSNNQVTLAQLSGRDESLFTSSDKITSTKVEVEKQDKRKTRKNFYQREQFKEDILKGIIFSEIVSEPKSRSKKRI